MKKSLPTLRAEDEGLGHATIMEPALAARYGVPYVHLVVFAIDLDRLREAVEADEEAESLWPFGWEVFLTELHLLGIIDPADPEHIDLLEDVVEDLMAYPPGDPPFGAQLAFAIHDAVVRGSLPAEISHAFKRWKKRPTELVESMDELFERADVEAADLAEACLEVALEPPLAPPTRDALEALIATYRDEPQEPESGAEPPEPTEDPRDPTKR